MDREDEIDFVILWVDGNDSAWQLKKKKYMPIGNSDVSVARYRNWDNLIYWFRGVEKFAPWVRKIHFVSDNQVPSWLNVNNKKIHIVSHSDYIPKEDLPLFNSSAIEVGIHRIPGLADKFVFFNDDMFLTAPITPQYYFTNGLPNDMAGLTRKCERSEFNTFANILCNNYDVINKYFVKKEVLIKEKAKWLHLMYGKNFLRTLCNLNRKYFDGIVIPHLSVPYKKSDFQKVWEKENELLVETQKHRFRENNDLSHFLFRFWRLCEGDFSPVKSKGRYIGVSTEEEIPFICQIIEQQKYPEICLNDVWKGNNYEKAKERINASFYKILSQKSEYEK